MTQAMLRLSAILLSVHAATVLCTVYTPVSHAARLRRHVSTGGRAKRQVEAVAAGTRSVSSDRACLLTCFVEFSHATRDVDPMAAAAASITDRAKKLQRTATPFYDEAVIVDVCAAFRALKQCMGECGVSEAAVSPAVRYLTGPLNYMCVQQFDTLRSVLPCYRDTNASVTRECETSCDGAESLSQALDLLPTRYRRALAAAARGGVGSKERREMDQQTLAIFLSVCGYVQCTLECQAPIYEAECESDTPALFAKGFFEAFFRNAVELLPHLPLREELADQCPLVTAGSVDGAVGQSKDADEVKLAKTGDKLEQLKLAPEVGDKDLADEPAVVDSVEDVGSNSTEVEIDLELTTAAAGLSANATVESTVAVELNATEAPVDIAETTQALADATTVGGTTAAPADITESSALDGTTERRADEAATGAPESESEETDEEVTTEAPAEDEVAGTEAPLADSESGSDEETDVLSVDGGEVADDSEGPSSEALRLKAASESAPASSEQRRRSAGPAEESESAAAAPPTDASPEGAASTPCGSIVARLERHLSELNAHVQVLKEHLKRLGDSEQTAEAAQSAEQLS